MPYEAAVDRRWVPPEGWTPYVPPDERAASPQYRFPTRRRCAGCSRQRWHLFERVIGLALGVVRCRACIVRIVLSSRQLHLPGVAV